MTAFLLRGGSVHDGLGGAARRADVLVVDDRVAQIGRVDTTAGTTVLDCQGLVVAPGFVDVHAHSDLVALMPGAPHGFKLLQGVTTEVNGNCGISPAPLTRDAVPLYEETFAELGGGVEALPGSFADHLARVEAAGPATNVAALVGHGTLRLSAAGTDVALTPRGSDRMRVLAAESLASGAIGLSTGLIYAPGCYSDTDELVELARVAALHGAAYTTHMRDEGDGLAASLAEAVEIGRRAGVRVEVSHCKAMGERAHGRGPELVATLEQARRDGIDILGDQYPYTAGATVLVALLPTEALSAGAEELRARLARPEERARLRGLAEKGGAAAGQWGRTRPDQVLITQHSDPAISGRRLDEIARDAAVEPWDALCRLVATDTAAMIVLELMREDDVLAIMRSPLVGIGSDSGPPAGLQHPRTWGCFPRFLGTYVRDRGVLPWEEAIRKATSLTARHLGLTGRGMLVPGAWADVVVLDPGTIGHVGTYAQPDVEPTGVIHVLVNGRPAVLSGRLTGQCAGRVLRRA